VGGFRPGNREAGPYVPLAGSERLVEFCVFGFGLEEDRDVGVGVFPRSEEILIGGASFCGVALESAGAGEIQLGDGEEFT
jgi:hypothetical protein